MSRSRWANTTKTLLNNILNPDKKGAKYQIKTIVLLNHLINFHNKCTKTFLSGSSEELAKYLGLPFDVCNRFLDQFTTPMHDGSTAGYAITKQLKDRRIVHILILYLLAHGREMKVGSINKVCEDIKLELKDAANFVREAGCKCTKGITGLLSVSLSVPLAFPPPKRSKK